MAYGNGFDLPWVDFLDLPWGGGVRHFAGFLGGGIWTAANLRGEGVEWSWYFVFVAVALPSILK